MRVEKFVLCFCCVLLFIYLAIFWHFDNQRTSGCHPCKQKSQHPSRTHVSHHKQTVHVEETVKEKFAMVGRFGLPSFIIMRPIKGSKCSLFAIIMLCFIPLAHCNAKDKQSTLDGNSDSSLFARKLMEKYGSGGVLTVKQLDELMKSIQGAKDAGSDHGPTVHDLPKTNGNGQEEHASQDRFQMCMNTTDASSCLDDMVSRFK